MKHVRIDESAKIAAGAEPLQVMSDLRRRLLGDIVSDG
jgi:hypothetical protein